MSLIPWRNKRRESDQGEASPLVTLRNEMDRLWDSFMREPLGALDWPFGGRGKWTPAIDVGENDEEIVVRAELPGMDPKDLEITITGNQLVLGGEKKEATESKGKDFYHNESRYGSFRRTIPLPDGVDSENAAAQYANGVLTLRLKKTRPTPAKRVEVQVKG
jgi:HSP20 family protein